MKVTEKAIDPHEFIVNGCMLTPGHGLGKDFWPEPITSNNGGYFHA